MTVDPSLLVTVTGPDRPGIAARVFDLLAGLKLRVADVEQVHVHGRLLLCVRVEGTDPDVIERVRLLLDANSLGDETLHVVVSTLDGPRRPRGPGGHLVTLLAPELDAATLAAVFTQITASGANVERIVRLSSYPVVSYELLVTGGDEAMLRHQLGAEAARLTVDIAVQRAGLHRRAKHLIVMDVDSTLLKGEVIDLLAARAGCANEVAAITEAAMMGDVDFSDALERRVALLGGLDVRELEALGHELTLTPGARTLVRTLQRLGYVTALVSGGFNQLISPLAATLGIDHVAANDLEIVDGRLTGRLVGPVVDRAGKANALRRFAAASGVPLARTIAVGDGANDIDMLATAGLGIAFNAKPVVRHAADTTLNVPYLDAILFLLGISREEIEAADGEPSATAVSH
jgi:phosphoserine phosphatase